MKAKTPIFVFLSLALFGVAWLVYDVIAISKDGTEASISYMFFEWSYKYPIFTLFCGFIPGFFAGHFFWRIRDTAGTKQLSDNSRGLTPPQSLGTVDISEHLKKEDVNGR